MDSRTAPEDGLLARTDRAVLVSRVLEVGPTSAEFEQFEHLDGFWLVKRGRVRCYAAGDVLIAELGELEGVLLPRGTSYRFEAVETVDDRSAELLQFEVSDVTMSEAWTGA